MRNEDNVRLKEKSLKKIYKKSPKRQSGDSNIQKIKKNKKLKTTKKR